MKDTELEGLFLRFRDGGDPAAIARLYDQVAPELLLVAAHFGGRSMDAEDLLQATFLAAMEAAPTFDSSRRVMPWLVGILVNQVRRERQRRQRRVDASRIEQRGVAPPERIAEEAEFAAVLAAELNALPPHYRRVLTLRWVHGFQPHEIAHALGESPETVKTRLRRGQEILKNLLPVGFAPVFALAPDARAGAAPADPLAAARQTVIDRARELCAARAPAAPVGSVPAAPAVALRAVAALAALGVGVAAFVVGGRGSDPGLGNRPAPAAALAAAASAGAAAAATPPLDPAERSASAAGSAPRPIAALRVQVVHADGTAATGAVVRLDREGAADPLFAERSAACDGTGAVTFADLEPGAYAITGDRGGATACALEPGAGTSATLVLPAGIDLVGRVRDGERPLGGARLWLSRADAQDEGTVVATTGPDGSFLLRSVAPGRALTVLADGYLPRPLQLVQGTAGERREIDLDLAGLASALLLRGRAVDESGAPVAGARVQVGNRLPFLDFDRTATTRLERTPPLALTTDADGRFEVVAPPTSYRRCPVYARAPGFVLATSEARFDGDAADVLLVLRRGVELTGRVADSGGAALAGVRLRARDPAIPDAAYPPRWADAVAWSNSAGEYRVGGIAKGQAFCLATAADGRRVSAEVEIGEGAEWNPVLHPLGFLAGTVVDADLTPLPGLKVRALVPRGRIEPAVSPTDASGRFLLSGCEDVEHTLWITRPASPWNGALASCEGLRPSASSAESSVVVVVPHARVPSATLEGRVVDERGTPVAARIALDSLDVGIASALADATTGRFAIGPIPPLRPGYGLHVETADRAILQRDGILLERGETLDLGDLAIPSPGDLEVRLADEAGRPLDARLALELADGTLAAMIDVRNGSGRSERLMPGDYRASLVDSDLALAAPAFAIEARGVARLELRAVPATLVELEFEHPRDGYETRIQVDWLDDRGALWFRDRFAAKPGEPLVAGRRLPPGRYALRAISARGLAAERWLEVGTAPADAPLRIPLR